MKRTIWICDRCGEEYKIRYKKDEFALSMYNDDEYETCDLCQNCQVDLAKWWKKGTKEKLEDD